MRWLPFAVFCALGSMYYYSDRASVKRKGHLLLTSTPARLVVFFSIWFLAFSSLGFAQGKNLLRAILVSALTGVAMAALYRWRLSRKRS